MTNTRMTIAWNNGTPRFNPPVGVTSLKDGDSVTVQLTGAPTGALIDTVTIYNNTTSGGIDAKGSQLCQWTRDGGNDCSVYTIAANSDTEVTITDADDSKVEQKYWFGVSGSPDSWCVDPELINKPGGGG